MDEAKSMLKYQTSYKMSLLTISCEYPLKKSDDFRLYSSLGVAEIHHSQWRLIEINRAKFETGVLSKIQGITVTLIPSCLLSLT